MASTNEAAAVSEVIEAFGSLGPEDSRRLTSDQLLEPMTDAKSTLTAMEMQVLIDTARSRDDGGR